MGSESFRALAAKHIQALNTLIVGATSEELHDILAALAATQAHVASQLLTAACKAQDRRHRMLTMPEAAERLGVSECTAREMGRRHELLVAQYGRAVRVSADEVDRYIREHSNGVHKAEARAVRVGLAGSVGQTPLAQLRPHAGGIGRRRN